MEVGVRSSPKHVLSHALEHARDLPNDFHALARIIWSRGTALDHVQTTQRYRSRRNRVCGDAMWHIEPQRVSPDNTDLSHTHTIPPGLARALSSSS